MKKRSNKLDKTVSIDKQAIWELRNYPKYTKKERKAYRQGQIDNNKRHVKEDEFFYCIADTDLACRCKTQCNTCDSLSKLN